MNQSKPPHDMPEFSTAHALSLLWMKAHRELHTHELEWFASGAAHHVALEADDLSETLLGIGLRACSTGNEELTDRDGIAHLFISLSRQVNTLSGLAQIAADASYLARQAGGTHGN